LQEIAAPVVNGAVRFPTAPGIGIELPEDLVKHFLIAPSQGWQYHDLQQ
jgi:L-alanine-DL-glutamate epimerase-like enolase superfamily enzyme